MMNERASSVFPTDTSKRIMLSTKLLFLESESCRFGNDILVNKLNGVDDLSTPS